LLAQLLSKTSLLGLHQQPWPPVKLGPKALLPHKSVALAVLRHLADHHLEVVAHLTEVGWASELAQEEVELLA
jgi:hypothetical protein